MKLSKNLKLMAMLASITLLISCGGGSSSLPPSSPVELMATNVSHGIELTWPSSSKQTYNLSIKSSPDAIDSIIIPNVISPFIINVAGEVSIGNYGTCAIEGDNVLCFRWDTSEKTTRLLDNPTHVSTGISYVSCALDDTGVQCWEAWQPLPTDSGQANVPPLSYPTQVRAGGGYSCATDDTGVVCWGANNNGQTDVPPLINPTQISLGANHSCAIDDTGVVCWGSDTYGQITAPTLTNPTQISAGMHYTCALDDTGVVCWGDDSGGQTKVPPLNNPTHIQTSKQNSTTCAIEESGVICWGRLVTDPTSTIKNPTYLSNGSPHCGWSDSGLVCGIDNGQEYQTTSIPTGLDVYHITEGKKYYFELVENDSNNQSLSSVASLTQLTAPRKFTGINNNSEIRLRWEAVKGAKTYTIYWNTTGNVTTSDTAIKGIVTENYNHTGLDTNNEYYYIVIAENDAHTSIPSKEILIP